MKNEVIIEIYRDQPAHCWVAKCKNPYTVFQSKEFNDIFKAFGHVLYGNALLNNTKVEMPEKIKVIINKEEIKEMNWNIFIPDWYKNENY